MLYIVATPIGNLEDITLRAIDILKMVDAIICEDTRRTSTLLNHFLIEKPLLILNDFNESLRSSFAYNGSQNESRIFQIIERLKNGENLALVSDAGTPLISDPGFKLVREALKEGIKVDSIPGPVSPIVALTLSGLPPDKFFFLGYLPEKEGKRVNFLNNLKEVNHLVNSTFIAFIAPHKLAKTLDSLLETFGDIEICLAKELTKIYQSVEAKKITFFKEEFSKKTPKGEFILLFNLKEP